MSVLLALAAFPILAVLLMALSRAEESLSHEVERDPLAVGEDAVAPMDVGRWIPELLGIQSAVACGGRHDLHQPNRAGGTVGPGVEPTFLLDDGSQQPKG